MSRALRAGDAAWRWVWTGGDSYGNVEVVVVRTNRLTVTVRYPDGHTLRVNPGELTPRLEPAYDPRLCSQCAEAEYR